MSLLTTPHVGQQTNKLLRSDWCFGKYYAYVCGSRYLRNDGKAMYGMQESVLDLNGGTYFLTQQEAQDCLDRYNATKDDSHKDTQT